MLPGKNQGRILVPLESGQGLISQGNGLLKKSVCQGTPCSALHPRQDTLAKGICALST